MDSKSAEFSKKNIEQVVQLVKNLPPLPAIALQAMKILEDPYATPGGLGKLIAQDTALAARVMKVANSSLFGRTAEVHTINDAIVLIGFKMLRGLILAAAMQKMAPYSVASKVIWRNAVGTALVSAEIAKELKYGFFDELFTQGLLHDVGKIVLLANNAGDYSRVLSGVGKGVTFMYAEEIYLGYTHTQVGDMLASKWTLPEDIREAIRCHHDILPADTLPDELTKIAIVKTADLISYMIGMGSIDGYPDTSHEALRYLTQLGVKDPDGFIDRCRVMCTNEEPLFH